LGKYSSASTSSIRSVFACSITSIGLTGEA
jgi:hypothetical protein